MTYSSRGTPADLSCFQHHNVEISPALDKKPRGICARDPAPDHDHVGLLWKVIGRPVPNQELIRLGMPERLARVWVGQWTRPR